MALRLRTFVTSNGLNDFVVATTSKAKALAAWGVGQDLFKGGLAYEFDDPKLIEAAEAEPGKVLQRPASTREAILALKPSTLEKRAAKPDKVTKTASVAPPPVAARPKLTEVPKPKGPSEADLRRVAEAEAKLAQARDAHAADAGQMDLDRDRLKAALAQLADERKALERKRLQLEADQAALNARAEAVESRFRTLEARLKERLATVRNALD